MGDEKKVITGGEDPVADEKPVTSGESPAADEKPVKKSGGHRPKGVRARPCTGNYKKPKLDLEIAKVSDPVQTVLDNMDPSGNVPQTTMPVKRRKPKSKFNGAESYHPMPPDGQSRAENAKTIRLALASLDLPAIDVTDPAQVRDRIVQYLEFCEQYDRMPSLIGMANWLGVGKQTLDSWKRGDFRADTHTPIIQKACAIMEEMLVEYFQKGRMHPAAGIFLLKNMFQYRDVQDVVVTPKNPLGDAEQQGQLEDKYLDIVDVQDDGE